MDYKNLANAIRMLSVDMVEKAKSGHPGLPMGMADVCTVLFTKFLKFNPHSPKWFDRDRFVLSAGHGSALLYSLLYLTGYEDMTLGELQRFRQLGSKTPGHPEYGFASGIETTTGPLGQGFANAVGMALSERILNAKFGNSLVSHKIYVLVGDGCLMEGISHEAISFAGHYKLNNLIAIFDNNNVSIDGTLDLSCSDNQRARFEASGWHVLEIDGHDYPQIEKAFQLAQTAEKPTLISCKTVIGYGAPNKQGSHQTHGSPLGKEETILARKNLGWDYEPFEVPQEVMSYWRNTWRKNEVAYKEWQMHFIDNGRELEDYLSNHRLIPATKKLAELKGTLVATPSEATRISSGRIIEHLSKELPNLVGGSADLTGSNNTKSSLQKEIKPCDYDGTYIHYGIREHGMAAIMNGIATHGGLLPYGGTFLCFSDYARPAIRLSALMQQRVIYIMTHDSIGLGEDGPTHQPVEHLASLRAIPNLYVFRPCDAVETLECWELALKSDKPSVIALTRQPTKKLRLSHVTQNLSAKGAYILKESEKNSDVTIFATGSEVGIADDVYNKLTSEGYSTKLVSVPCMDMFFEQDIEYQRHIIDSKSFKVAIEAGCSVGWEKVIGSKGLFFGVEKFGESAPYADVYEHFNLIAGKIYHKIITAIK